MSIAFACSDDPVQLPSGFEVPGILNISGVSLGQGNVLDGGSSKLACDRTVAVSLDVADWKLRPPGTCDVTQCGRVHLELSAPGVDVEYTLDQETASEGVRFVIVPYDTKDNGSRVVTHTPVSGTYTLTANLIDDAGNLYNPGDGGQGEAEVSFRLDLPMNCDAIGSAGAGGTGSDSEAGAGGLAGGAGAADSAGAAGQSSAGTAGNDGVAGNGGMAGNGGASPEAGAAGE